MSEHTVAVGDRVICDPATTPARFHGTVYTVERVDRVNVALAPVAGGPRLRIRPSLLLPAPTGDGASVTLVTVAPPPPPLTVGAVVTIADAQWRGNSGPYVVLADNGPTVKVAVLGGDNFKFWPRVARAWVTEVDRDRLLAAFAHLTGGTR
ncbi:hypothetical protein [Dactylosporangium sp. NPDC000521]|uniref:hypothetical protein n=1 Tax=Dactylosporangium sp. NPDC000521 TaxID=3363975 RepID=UPI003696A507